MAFATVHTIKSPRFSSFRLKNWNLSFNGWRHRSPIKEVDVYLLPAIKLIFRQGGRVRMVKLEVSVGVWTAQIAVFHGV